LQLLLLFIFCLYSRIRLLRVLSKESYVTAATESEHGRINAVGIVYNKYKPITQIAAIEF